MLPRPEVFVSINDVLFPFFKHPASQFSASFANTYQCLLIDEITERKFSIVCENIQDDEKIYSILQDDELLSECSQIDLITKYEQFMNNFPNARFMENL